jgi:hypothetical protein
VPCQDTSNQGTPRADQAGLDGCAGAGSAPVHRRKDQTIAHAIPASPLRTAVGDFIPKIVDIAGDVLSDDVGERPEPAKRDRSRITVADLIMGTNVEHLGAHLQIARTNGLTETELNRRKRRVS